MKKLFLLSAAALMVLASCTKDEVAQTPDQKITFSSPVVNAITKANVYGDIFDANGKYNTAENFNVFGVFAAEAYNAANAKWDATDLYMDEVECAYDTDNATWDPASVEGGQSYYWPKKGTLTFSAYSPANVEETCTPSCGIDGITFTNFTVPATTEKQFDLMYSARTYDKTSSTGGTSYNGVDINFKHALTQILFTAASEEDYDDVTITLKKIDVKSALNSGTFKQYWSDANKDDDPVWTRGTTTANYAVHGTSTELSTTEYTCTEAMVLPQKLTDNVVVVIKYSIKHGDNGLEVEQEHEIKLNTLVNDTDEKAITKWLMGYKYTYNVVIGLDKITFSPEVEAWEEVTGVNSDDIIL